VIRDAMGSLDAASVDVVVVVVVVVVVRSSRRMWRAARSRRIPRASPGPAATALTASSHSVQVALSA